MKGRILHYDRMHAEGVISAEDGSRIDFSAADWRGDPAQLRTGMDVDFVEAGGRAGEMYPLAPSYGSSGALGADRKNPIVAGLLALFFGGLGIHKFYLGYNSEGVLLLASTLISWVLIFVLIGIPALMIIGLVVFIEAILYLVKSEDEFNHTYVENRRPWF